MKPHSAEAVVTNTIQLTESLLSRNQLSWEDARAGVEFIREDLARRWPKDSSMVRTKFDEWLRVQDARFARFLYLSSLRPSTAMEQVKH